MRKQHTARPDRRGFCRKAGKTACAESVAPFGSNPSSAYFGFIGVLGFLFLALTSSVLQGSEEWKEIRLDDETIIVRPAAQKPEPQGRVFAAQGRITLIRAAADLGEAARPAVADIERYLPLACGGKTAKASRSEMAPSHDFTLFLATSKSKDDLSWTGLDHAVHSLGPQECLVLPVDKFPDGTPGVVLIGGSARGLLNGVYTLLEKSAGIFWEPARNARRGAAPSPQPSPKPARAETILCSQEIMAWPHGVLHWKPAVSERVFYTGMGGATIAAIDWASRNRLSRMVISTPRDFPMKEDEEKQLKAAVDYAHALGIKVLFLNMTHRLPTAQRSLPPSSPEALKASTDLFAGLVSRFGVDGFAWHSASEGIEIAADKIYQQTPREQWEARYFNSYYQAIRTINKDAMLVMLMGWVYMNPASEMATLFPSDTVAWVVPNTSIIDAALTDLPSYDEHFDNVWYWLYVVVSADGAFPMVKLDYLETYFADALKRGHGLAPQGVSGINAANSMYFVQTARDGLVPHPEYLRSFAERYFGDARVGEALLAYQKALVHHRNWYNNVHTRDVRNSLTMEESWLLKSAFEGFVNAAGEAKSPLIKDRLRVHAITALRCLVRRAPHLNLPKERLDDWTMDWMKDYGWSRPAIEAMVPRFEEVFGSAEPLGGEDFYGEEYRKIRAVLLPAPAGS